MGSQSSRAENVLTARLEAMDIKKENWESDEESYVEVENEKKVVVEVVKRLDKEWTSLDVDAMAEWERTVLRDAKNRLALSAFTSGDFKSILTSQSTKIHDQQVFNVKIDFEGGPITNQRSSGRCWLFAATNVFRVGLMKLHNLDDFELSQSYLFYWDKLEKANYFLENILDTTDEELDARLIQTLMGDICGDGGQWDMAVNIVKKYGLVPQVMYPDSFNAMNSSALNTLIKTKLREDALILRKMATSASTASINEMKEKMMREIHLILTLTLGPPPLSTEKFTWDFVDKTGKACSMTTTPLDFANELSGKWAVHLLACDIQTMFSLVNDPRHEYMTHLTVSRLGNVWSPSSRPITYINVPMSTMKAACISMLKNDLPIFFGSDVGKYSNRQGIMDLSLIDYELGFNVKLGMTKRERLMTGESAMTHAMVLTAVHLDIKGQPVRWRVQNSWGTEAGDKGWFVMSDEWFDQFVYQAVVPLNFVDKAVRECLNKKPIVLPLWDPMGALA